MRDNIRITGIVKIIKRDRKSGKIKSVKEYRNSVLSNLAEQIAKYFSSEITSIEKIQGLEIVDDMEYVVANLPVSIETATQNAAEKYWYIKVTAQDTSTESYTIYELYLHAGEPPALGTAFFKQTTVESKAADEVLTIEWELRFHYDEE